MATRFRVHLSLGSNLGDRTANLARAVSGLAALPDTKVSAVSRVWETAPWGVADQPVFHNLAVEIGTALGPLELLNAVKGLETRLGRGPGFRWGPRLVDVDVVLWESLILDTPALSLPHPRFRERAFVLWPLAEIAPGAVDPVTGRTVAELADAMRAAAAPETAQPLAPLAWNA
ncbi:MAG: 2-amino-4-hydroxy-6-hydroxymethyldihydropteridine diphosphokinase [Candidatus Hydrogenedens sp.]|nr:2-amino-4-hydroxy-6-hydroxymethyldihydropteridine diphosphokinase [Candidatus Hydrogenedentota bacterium]NLF57348.1 2-amino-4-hydroxy-6-hydroxymethyldihydropteridine diphosphokinase [Candidatus Hydrogenedens sp.]